MQARRTPLMIRLAVVLALGAAHPAWSADPLPSRAAQFYEDALQRFENKDHKGAIVQLKNAIKLDRKMLQAQVLMGRALLANGEINAAEAALDEALKLGVNPTEVVLPLAEALIGQGKPDLVLSQPRFAHAGLAGEVKSQLLLLKAAAASDLGRPRDAIKLLEEARNQDSKNAESWAAEVPIRVRSRQFAEARLAADKAVALDPKSPRAAYQQATVAHVSGDLKSAVKLYTRTLELKPDHVDALVARGGVYLDLGRIDEATVDVQAARKADAKDPRSAYMSAMLAERLGQTAEVKKALTEVTNLLDPFPLDYIRYRPQVLMLGGMSHYAMDQFEKAKPYLEMVLRQDPNSPVSKLLARIYLKDKRTDKAIEALDIYLRNHPGDVQASTLLASSHMAQGRPGRAAQIMEEALKKTDEPAARALYGMSLVGAGKYAPAATELEATLKKDPNQIQAGISLVSLYIASSQGAKAVAVAEGLVKRQPANAGLVSLLGSAHAAKGDAAAARAAFEQALKLDPKYLESMLNLARLDIDEKAFEAAQTRLNTLLAKDERNVEAMIEVARLFAARDKPEEAQRWLQRADDNSGQRLRASLQLVDFHLARNRPDLARDAVKRLQSKAPDAIVVLLANARVQLANKETAEAKSTLTRASTQAAYDPAALAQIGELQMLAGNLPGAAHALDKALAAKPDHLRARTLRSSVHLMQGEPAKAEQMARGLIASDPKSGVGHALLGDLARSRNQNAAAAEAYRKAHQLEPSSTSLLRLFNALDAGQHNAAVALAEQWLKGKPADATVWRALADSQARSGNMAAARDAYQQVVKLLPQDAESVNNLAVVQVSLKDPAALQTAEKALALRPDLPYVIGTAGWAAFHANQADRALQLLRDARLRDPNNAATRYYLGTVLAKMGRQAEAKQELQAAIGSGTSFAYAKEAAALLKTLN